MIKQPDVISSLHAKSGGGGSAESYATAAERQAQQSVRQRMVAQHAAAQEESRVSRLKVYSICGFSGKLGSPLRDHQTPPLLWCDLLTSFSLSPGKEGNLPPVSVFPPPLAWFCGLKASVVSSFFSRSDFFAL